ncbi:hypothetical protein, partial, partial [Absidia glauca]
MDLYGHSPSPLPPIQNSQHQHHNSKYTLKNLAKDQWCNKLDSLEQHDERLRGLKTHVTLYLDSLTRQSRGNIAPGRCVQLFSLDVKVYENMQFTEKDEDNAVDRTTVRAGRFYNKIYNDHIKAIDVTKPMSASREYQMFYGKVLYFLEVTHGDMKKYRLSVGQLYDTVEGSHPTGYKML